ncbi:hypothetical protein SASPL_145484 [Salvia splendens]|uniref:Methyltransferase n=1 Tax=Salvia splendens TaxID=180675 RepID=A0A8X8WIL4_SALSN|nr:hypothetical protein SASPL_145484 [Salvia splendens]
MSRGRPDGAQKKRLLTTVFVVALFLVFLYVYHGSKNTGESALEYGSRSLRKLGSSYLGGDEDSDLGGKQDEAKQKSYYQMRLKLDLSLMEHYERHCPLPERRFNCLIPPPPGYKIPIKWPSSRDEVWKAKYTPHSPCHEKSDQNWMVVKGDRIHFPGGGTHFHYGADKYIAHLANMLNFSNNVLNNEGRLRTVFDVGCGVASFGGYLLSSNIITMSLAPNDVHQNQIQFALERGIPAYLGVLGTKRLPYPSRSFELAHCSRCRIDWLQRDGILLLELDRVLRPGGYFAYSSPEAYAQDEEDLRIWKEMSALVERMCWRIAVKKNQTVIWQKPLSNDCYFEREHGTQPPLCRSDDDPDAVGSVLMEPCITHYSDHDHQMKGSGLAPWPARLITPPPRLLILAIRAICFEKDLISSDTIRNVMDMKANLGSFAAALNDKDVWVMNVVADDGPKRLRLSTTGGLIGSVHNWCEAFSTYPRTYDLLHAWNVLSDIEKKGCSGEDLLLEMDRILRPAGFAIFRDRQPVGDEAVFIIQKKLWLTSESFRDAE